MIHNSECVDFLQETALKVLRPYVYALLPRELSEVVYITTMIE